MRSKLGQCLSRSDKLARSVPLGVQDALPGGPRAGKYENEGAACHAGDPTLSVSCSDKLARWALLGVQGALLGELLCAPLHLAGLAVCGATSDAALRRAIEGAHASPANTSGACAHWALILSIYDLKTAGQLCSGRHWHMQILNLGSRSPKPSAHQGGRGSCARGCRRTCVVTGPPCASG